jgi:hypothetical protein
MTEFVSGLQREAPVQADRRGIDLLARIRAYASSTADGLSPLCQRRFDGAEWLQPEPEDITAKEDCDAIVRLVDLITADKQIAAIISARLARAGAR